MKILLLCEGLNEEVLVNILLDANAFCFSRDDLIGLRPYPIRQLNNPTIKSELQHYGLPVRVYRIGDKQNDKLTIPKDLREIILSNEVYKYCTKPELEILLILNEGLEKEYEKVKSLQSPKEFAKKNIKYNGKKYDQSSDFLRIYYGEDNAKKLIQNIKKYKQYKRHKDKNQLYLADILK